MNYFHDDFGDKQAKDFGALNVYSIYIYIYIKCRMIGIWDFAIFLGLFILPDSNEYIYIYIHESNILYVSILFLK